MSLILNIDTASETAQINIAQDGLIVQEVINTNQKEHAAFVQPAIQSLLKKAGNTLQDLAAVAVVYGPGSYTGLRVGMASAKGLCIAINKPLITVGALEILAAAAINENKLNYIERMLFCPMIDARRMEVFTAVYDSRLTIISPATALILDDGSFVKMLLNNPVAFFGSGAAKWHSICTHKNASFPAPAGNGLAMSKLSFDQFLKNDLADVAYSEPLYLKEFYMAQNVR